MKSLFLLLMATMCFKVIGQVSINTSGTAPVATSILDISSTSKGILIPRMAIGDRDLIGTPATSLMIFNTSSNSYNYWNGSAWIAMAAGNIKELSDANGDTKIQVEFAPDEDTIRFSANGTQQLRLDGKMAQLESPGRSLFIGHKAGMNDNGTDNTNTYIGYESGKANVTGAGNTFLGTGTGDVNTASNNTFIGLDAGGANTTGIQNTFIGKDAGKANTIAGTNTFIGSGAGALNTATGNTFIGQSSGALNTDGTGNTFVGHGAGDVSTGSNNTFMGDGAGGSNTTGTENTFVGKNTGDANNTGSSNSFFGNNAGGINSDGIENTYIGESAGAANSTGDFNVFVGQNAGIGCQGGSSNTCIGENANTTSGSFTNATALGKTAIALDDNTVRIGNTSVTDIRGHVNFSNDSDARFKRDVSYNVPGLDFISRLKPVTYTWDIDALCRHIGEPLVPELTVNRAEASTILYTGLLAQEVEAAANEIGFNFSGVVIPDNQYETYSLRYAEFTVPLIKAVQEQQTEIKTLQNSIATMTSQMESLKAQVETLVNKSE